MENHKEIAENFLKVKIPGQFSDKLARLYLNFIVNEPLAEMFIVLQKILKTERGQISQKKIP